MGNRIDHKICLISFASGSMGAKLGYFLFKKYPEIFSIYDYWNGLPGKTYHIYNPHLAFLWHNPEVPYSITNTKEYKKLNKTKWNIVLTHNYTANDLQIIKNLIPDDELKIIKIVYQKNEIEEIVKRFYEVTDRKEDHAYLSDLMLKNLDSGTGEACRVPYSLLKNNSEIDLSHIIKYITGN